MEEVKILEFLGAVFALVATLIPIFFAIRHCRRNRARGEPGDVEMGAPAAEARLQNPIEGERPQNGVEEAAARVNGERPQNGVEEARRQPLVQNNNNWQCFNFFYWGNR